MEQPLRSRLGRLGLTAAGLIALVLLAVLGFRPRRDRVPGHAYAIPSARDRILVEVLNGTPRQGLARAGTRRLRRQGLDVVFFGNAEEPADSTRIIVHRGSEGAAESVVRALGAGRVAVTRDTLRRVDVTVILGEDYRPEREWHP